MTEPVGRRVSLATGLAYQVWQWGADDAPTALLLHGFLDIGRSWSRVAEVLSAKFRVIAPDLRGHGDSDWIGAGGYYHFPDYLADVDSLVDIEAPNQTVAVVGHSMGGTIASLWAGVRPQRCRRLALLEGLGPPLYERDLATRVQEWIDAWRRAQPRITKTLADLDAAAARLRHHDPQVSAAWALQLATWSTRSGDDGLRWKHDPLHLTVGPTPFRRELANALWQRITCPVLLVDGERSTFRLPDGESAARAACFRDVRATQLAAAGHMMHRHQPEALAELLLPFLD